MAKRNSSAALAGIGKFKSEADRLYPRATAEWKALYVEFRQAGSTPSRALWHANNAMKIVKAKVVEQ